MKKKILIVALAVCGICLFSNEKEGQSKELLAEKNNLSVSTEMVAGVIPPLLPPKRDKK